jgi:hypothetical protein
LLFAALFCTIRGMLESGKNDFILKKSYEISYALWRIAANVAEKSLSAKIAEKAVGLIGIAADGDNDAIAAKLPGIEFLIKFAVDTSCISVGNGEVLAKEIGNLKSAIFNLNAANSLDELITPGREYDLDIAGMFSEDELPETKIDMSDSDIDLQVQPARNQPLKKPNGKVGESLKAEARQSAILERIRQIGNCRLSDIQAILPDCSERTIRYDLESMVQRNLIERVGTGGRSVYYRIRDSVLSSN